MPAATITLLVRDSLSSNIIVSPLRASLSTVELRIFIYSYTSATTNYIWDVFSLLLR